MLANIKSIILFNNLQSKIVSLWSFCNEFLGSRAKNICESA